MLSNESINLNDYTSCVSPKSTLLDEKKTTLYNENNKLISKLEIENIFKSNGLDISIKNLKIYEQAFVHKSYCKKKETTPSSSDESYESDKPLDVLELQEESNERLEYIGDAVISSACAKYLYDRFPEQDEGFLTRIRTKIVNGESLAKLAKEIGLSKFLIISKNVEDKTSGRDNMRILEDTFESFFGAILLDFNEVDFGEFLFDFDDLKNEIADIKNVKEQLLKSNKKENNKSITKLYNIIERIDKLINNDYKNKLENLFYSGPGFQIAESLFINIIEKYLYWPDLILKDSNYKDQLLRYFQHEFQNTPKYIESSTDGPPHKRMFTMAVLDINGNILGTGRERSKKKAEQLASKEALIKLNCIGNERY